MLRRVGLGIGNTQKLEAHTQSVQDPKRNIHPLCHKGQRDGLKDIGKASQST